MLQEGQYLMLTRILGLVPGSSIFKAIFKFCLTLGFTVCHLFHNEKLPCANPQNIIIAYCHLLKAPSMKFHDKFHSISIKVLWIKREEIKCLLPYFPFKMIFNYQILQLRDFLQYWVSTLVVKLLENDL